MDVFISNCLDGIGRWKTSFLHLCQDSEPLLSTLQSYFENIFTECLINPKVMIRLCVGDFEFVDQNLFVDFGLFYKLKVDHVMKSEIEVLQSICSRICSRCKVRRGKAAFLDHFNSITAPCCVSWKQLHLDIMTQKIYYIINADIFGSNEFECVLRCHEQNFKTAEEWNIPIEVFIETNKHKTASVQKCDNISRANCEKTFCDRISSVEGFRYVSIGGTQTRRNMICSMSFRKRDSAEKRKILRDVHHRIHCNGVVNFYYKSSSISIQLRHDENHVRKRTDTAISDDIRK